MSAKALGFYYPDRFSAVKFYDPIARATVCIPTAVLNDDLPDSGRVLAAAPRRGRKRHLANDDDDDDEAEEDGDADPNDRSIATLRRIEQADEQKYSQRDVNRLSNMARGYVARVLSSPPMSTLPDTSDHVTTERAWLCYQVVLIERIATEVPMISACINSIKNRILSDGIKFMRGNVELIPSRVFQEYVVRRLHPFAYACIDAYLMLGIIPVLFELDPSTGQRWPYVPALGTYMIKRHTVRGAIRYRFYWTDEMAYREAWRRQAVKVRDATGIRWSARSSCEPCGDVGDDMAVAGVYDPTVLILHNLGHEITSTGSLTSKLASLIAMAYNRMRAQRARMIADINAAMPPIVTEYDHAAEKTQSRTLSEGFYASVAAPPDIGGLAEPESIEKRTFQRDALQREAMVGLLRRYESESGSDAANVFNVRHDEYRSDLGGTAVTQATSMTSEGVPAAWSNQYHLSSARKLVRGPDAHAASDYVGMLSYMDDEVCGVLGIPKTYVLGEAIRAGTELVTNRLSDEDKMLKKMISDIMTTIYHVVTQGDDVRQYLESDERTQRRRSTGNTASTALISEDDLYVSDAIKRVRVTFVKKSSENPAELFQMYALGAIGKHLLCSELARRNNFDPSQLCAADEEDDIPKEQRHFLIKEWADYYQWKSQGEQKEAEMKMQKDQTKQDGQLKREDMHSREKQNKQNNDVKKAQASKPKSSGGSSSSSAAAGGSAGKSAGTSAAAASSKKIEQKLSEVSKAASTLAAAGAALKKAKLATEEKSKK